MSHDDLHFGPRPSLRTGMRLTRRGRLLLLAVLALVALGLFSLGRVSGNAETASTSTRYEKVVVQPGDTLWSIAKTHQPGKDPRGYVARIVELNSLPSADVVIGQTIALPS